MSYVFRALAYVHLHSQKNTISSIGLFYYRWTEKTSLLEYDTIWREYGILHDGYAGYWFGRIPMGWIFVEGDLVFDFCFRQWLFSRLRNFDEFNFNQLGHG